MIAPTQIPKPQNWQDFEKLCKKLWGEIWNCSDTIQKNGRSGQAQHGVDIYGIPHTQSEYYGIQCKGKDDYTHAQLTKQEIDHEIENAKLFQPKLKRLIFATTANKDVAIEEYVRLKNQESIEQGGFEVYVSSWEDIVELMEEYEHTYNWYVRNLNFRHTTSITVSFDGEETLEINPQYFRFRHITKLSPTYEPNSIEYFRFQQENNPLLKQLKDSIERQRKQQELLNAELYGIYKKNYSICYLPIVICNTGDVTLENYCVRVWFENTDYVGDCFCYVNHRLMDAAEKAAINRAKDENREVFKDSSYSNVVNYRPKRQSLVPGDSASFEVSIIPEQDTKTVIMHWELLSNQGKLNGENTISVVNEYIDKDITTDIQEQNEYKEPYITIEPRIE